MDRLYEVVKKIDIELNDHQLEQFQRYYELLVEWNKVMNLTGITEFEEVLTKNFLDSLACVKAIDMTKVKTIMDIGTGAGFPGVPLKIAFPHLEACLLDSLKKRVNFLEESFELLGLEGIKAIHGRAEEYAKNKEYREKYDLCVSRAVANLSTLSEYCLPFVKVGGKFISYKSEKITDEMNAAQHAVKILGGKMDGQVEKIFLGNNLTRSTKNYAKILKDENLSEEEKQRILAAEKKKQEEDIIL